MSEAYLRADYLSIATEALTRGFQVTPIHPGTKAPVLRAWNKFPTATQSQVLINAHEFPHHNVGIVSKRGLGNLLFLDIDGDGVEERIAKETGRTMPATYTVCSRPTTAPYKRHYYFRQTEYSLSKLGRKTVCRKDLTSVNDKGLHPTLYDLKGHGGAAYVVGAGSVRHDTLETYEVINEAPVAPIPDYLVDWLVEDIHQFRSGMKKEQIERRSAQKAQEADLEKAVSENNQALYADLKAHKLAEVGKDYGYAFLRSRAGSLASLGLGRELIQTCLLHLAKAYVEDSESFTEVAHKEAWNPALKFGKPTYGKKWHSDGLTINPPAESRHSKLVGIMKTFPDEVTSADGYHLLGLDPSDRNHQKAASLARKETGLVVRNVAGKWRWIRQP